VGCGMEKMEAGKGIGSEDREVLRRGVRRKKNSC